MVWGNAWGRIIEKATQYKRVPRGQRVVNSETGKIVRGGQPMPIPASQRQKYPDGRTVPEAGDAVFKFVPGFGGSEAVIHGEIVARAGQKRVKITGASAMIGGGYSGPKSVALDPSWTVRGEQSPYERQRESREQQLRQAEVERRTQNALNDQKIAESRAAGNQHLDSVQPEMGMRLHNVLTGEGATVEQVGHEGIDRWIGIHEDSRPTGEVGGTSGVEWVVDGNPDKGRPPLHRGDPKLEGAIAQHADVVNEIRTPDEAPYVILNDGRLLKLRTNHDTFARAAGTSGMPGMLRQDGASYIEIRPRSSFVATTAYNNLNALSQIKDVMSRSTAFEHYLVVGDKDGQSEWYSEGDGPDVVRELDERAAHKSFAGRKSGLAVGVEKMAWGNAWDRAIKSALPLKQGMGVSDDLTGLALKKKSKGKTRLVSATEMGKPDSGHKHSPKMWRCLQEVEEKERKKGNKDAAGLAHRVCYTSVGKSLADLKRDFLGGGELDHLDSQDDSLPRSPETDNPISQ